MSDSTPDDGVGELVRTLRSRRDGGRPFWDEVRRVMDEQVPDRPTRSRPPAQRGVVYYVRFADRVKIGTTTNLAMRMQSVPHDEVLATEPGGRSIESQRHRQFAHLRMTGEWFSMGPDLMAHIGRIATR